MIFTLLPILVRSRLAMAEEQDCGDNAEMRLYAAGWEGEVNTVLDGLAPVKVLAPITTPLTRPGYVIGIACAVADGQGQRPDPLRTN